MKPPADMSAEELRIACAEAMGWEKRSEDRWVEPKREDSTIRLSVDQRLIPDFGGDDWTASGAINDEIERRGWQWVMSSRGTTIIRRSSQEEPDHLPDDVTVEDRKPVHRAVALAFLEAHRKENPCSPTP